MSTITRTLHTWGDNRTLQPEHDGFDLIEVATDGSLDEGDCVLRTTAHGPSILSSGTEYFVQVDISEVEALIQVLEVAQDDREDENGEISVEIASILRRARRVLQYMDVTNTRAGHVDRIEEQV